MKQVIFGTIFHVLAQHWLANYCKDFKIGDPVKGTVYLISQGGKLTTHILFNDKTKACKSVSRRKSLGFKSVILYLLINSPILIHIHVGF